MFESRPPKKRKERPNRPFLSGKITSIESQARNPERANVFIDGKFGFGIDWSLVAEHRLVRDKVVTPELALVLQKANQLQKAKSVALEYLSHKARTRKEVEDKLLAKEYPPEIVEQVVQRMLDLGYINDEQYAKNYTKSRYQSKGYGPRRIQMELYKRGIRGSQAEEAVREIFEAQEDPLDSIREKARRKWVRLVSSESDPRKRQKKMGDFLMRRGFQYDDVRRLVEEFQQEPIE
jgi:regulatory protein